MFIEVNLRTMYLKVEVIPEAKEERLEQLKYDEYRIWIKFPAENNLANRRLLEVFRNKFPGTSVRIISGHHSPSKIISID